MPRGSQLSRYPTIGRRLSFPLAGDGRSRPELNRGATAKAYEIRSHRLEVKLSSTPPPRASVLA